MRDFAIWDKIKSKVSKFLSELKSEKILKLKK